MANKVELMPNTGPYSKCTKCGGSGSSSYCEGLPEGAYIFGFSRQCQIQDEHLHKQCLHCGYKWLEKCAS